MNHFTNFILSFILSLFIVNASINPDNFHSKNIVSDTVIAKGKTEKPIVYIQQDNTNIYLEIFKTIISVFGGCVSTIGIAYINNRFKKSKEKKLQT